ncbi:MAG: CRISPR-associated protein Cas4 [Chloroflexi bacterium]|nr:CRISPR-associated protein Cas4 [Chloroflexota bacterium]
MNGFLLALVLLALAVLLWIASTRLRAGSGMPDGQVIYSDTGPSRNANKSLYSQRYGIAGKPDYLVRTGKSITPVEVKSGPAPAQPREGHVLQLAAYCLLVEEQLGAPVHRGIIRYNNREFVIDWNDDLKADLLDVLADMRADIQAGSSTRSHDHAARCRSCSVREFCEQRL